MQLSWYSLHAQQAVAVAVARRDQRCRGRPGEVSSIMVRIGRRRLVCSAVALARHSRPMVGRVCSIDMNSVRSSALKHQVSTTCCAVGVDDLDRLPLAQPLRPAPPRGELS